MFLDRRDDPRLFLEGASHDQARDVDHRREISTTGALDSSVLYILEPQLCVHWLCPTPGSYGIRRVFSCKSAYGSEASSLSIAIGRCLFGKAFSYLTGPLRIRQHRHGSYVIRVQTVNTCQKVIQPIKTAERLACSPPTKANRVQTPAGSLPIFACGNRAGIVPDDAAARWVFSGISPLFIPALLHTHLATPSSALKTSLLRATRIYSLTPPIKYRIRLVRSGDDALDARGIVAFIAPKLLGLKRAIHLEVGGGAYLYDEYGAAPEWKDRGNGRSQRKLADQRGIVRHDSHTRMMGTPSKKLFLYKILIQQSAHESGVLSLWCNNPYLVKLSLHEAEEYPGNKPLAELQKRPKIPVCDCELSSEQQPLANIDGNPGDLFFLCGFAPHKTDYVYAVHGNISTLKALLKITLYKRLEEGATFNPAPKEPAHRVEVYQNRPQDMDLSSVRLLLQKVRPADDDFLCTRERGTGKTWWTNQEIEVGLNWVQRNFFCRFQASERLPEKSWLHGRAKGVREERKGIITLPSLSEENVKRGQTDDHMSWPYQALILAARQTVNYLLNDVREGRRDFLRKHADQRHHPVQFPCVKDPGPAPPGIEHCSSWCEASVLAARTPRPIGSGTTETRSHSLRLLSLSVPGLMARIFNPTDVHEVLQIGYRRMFFQPYDGILQLHVCNDIEHWCYIFDNSLSIRFGEGIACYDCAVRYLRPDSDLSTTLVEHLMIAILSKEI
ncbi:hypothetical protein PR048_015181 [Dryococelus australis]|uniref:Uncharacterized protein n=1 Tax=Dryococelus australis TaxID=614101 RepID=A0ABQ9HG90_9NEOP|nr:hypothetical protein PR048_015181 [Dryococelus australis]